MLFFVSCNDIVQAKGTLVIIIFNKKKILKEVKIIYNVKYPIVFKSVKISDETHKKLQSIGKVKETFEVIKRLLDNYSKEKGSLMRVLKIPGRRNIEINFTKQENDWADKDPHKRTFLF